MACGLCVGVASTAWADARVTVTLRDKAGAAAEGRVALLDEAGKEVAACETAKGKCEMSGVKGGTYRAEVRPRSGPPPKPREVMIPPTGDVSLIVSTQ